MTTERPTDHDPDAPHDDTDEPHGSADHGAEHGHDDHAHQGGALGPIDVPAWGALVGGIALGLVVAVCIGLSTGALG